MKKSFSFIHSRVARRIFVLFVICALLPVCVLALVSLQRFTSKLEEDSHKRLHQVGMNAGMAIHEGLNLLQTELESMPVSTGDDVKMSTRQAAHAGREKRFRTITVMNHDTESGIIPDIPHRLAPAAHAHLAAGNALILSDGDVEAGHPLYMVTSANPSLPRNSLLVGVINSDYLWPFVESTMTAGIDICVLSPSGKTLYTSRSLAPSLVSLVMSKQNGTPSGQLNWQHEDEDFLVNYWSLFMKPAFLADSWTVVAVQSRNDSTGPARSFITIFLLVVLLTLLVVVFISSVLIRRSLVPLSILKDGAQNLSKGNFDTRVEITSGDEFEDLAASFNDMSEQLGDQFTRLSDMGKLVQKILETRDKDTIIKEVIFHYCNIASYEWIGISLTDVNAACLIQTSYCNCSDGISTKTAQFEVLLSEEESNTLRIATEGLHVRSTQGFISLLAPMVNEGACEFLLQPIHIKDKLLGVFLLGYRQEPKQIRDEVVRSRQVADEIAIALDNIRLIDELNWLNQGTIEVLANAVDAKSPWTAGHSHRVTMLALEIGKEMGLSRGDLELLQLSGLFHDIGKIGIPEYILDKPGRLTEEEYIIIKDHPGKGAEMLKPIRAYHEVIPLVAQHHEHYDGQGYPLGLSGGEIVLGARILAVADVFDALYSNRPYREGWEKARVISFLEEKAGSNFDPDVVKAFMMIDLTAYLEFPTNYYSPNPV